MMKYPLNIAILRLRLPFKVKDLPTLCPLLLSFLSTVASAEEVRGLTQDQVDTLLAAPDQSVALIQSLNSPLAAGWKAYLQFTGNWPGVAPGPSAEVDEAMAALRKASEATETESQEGHYETLTQVLYDIRFTSHPDFIAPCWLFERHPEEAGRAFGMYYGSGRDGAVGFCQLTVGDPEVFSEFHVARNQLSSTFLVTEWKATVEPEGMPWCGTMRVGIYREISMNEVLFLLHPKRLQTEQNGIESTHRSHLKTLADWTAAHPDHAPLLDAYETARDAFVPHLEQRYSTANQLPPEEASRAAMLWTMVSFNAYLEEELRCLGRWNPSDEP